MARLTIDLTDQQHQTLKATAALESKTIRQYALERLLPTESEDDQAWDEMKALLDERIAQGLAGCVSSKGVAGIADEELRRTGEA
jgi:hypothetical protein